MPDDQEIVGITERLVEQEPVISAATGSLNENPPETLMEEAQTLDKVEHCLQFCITQHMATLLLSHPQITFFIFFQVLGAKLCNKLLKDDRLCKTLACM